MRATRMEKWSAIVLLAGFLAINWMERRRPLRISTQPRIRREARNLTLAAIGAVAMQLAERPAAVRLARLAERRRIGLVRMYALPRAAETMLALALMDYSMYVWHILTHRVPLLWRFHLVHHVDLDMDASTALRFHFGELLASVPWRAAQVLAIGLTPETYFLWQAWFIGCILLHHSDMRLPARWERWLLRFLVTPRMHGIHHSVVEAETNSNWSSGLSIWDRLHGTFRFEVPQREVTIGVPAYRDPASVTLPRILAMPFEPLPDVWHSETRGLRS